MESAVRELQLTGKTKPSKEASQPKKAATRRAINDASSELILLVSEEAPYKTLTEKIEALDRHVQAMLAHVPARK